MKNCIILTGGGTAGHVSVNINLQTALKKNFKKIIYIGSKNGIEKELINNRTDYQYIPITTTKFERKKFLRNLKIPFLLLKSIREARKIIKKYKPDVIFSKGGYVGLPVVIAGKKENVKVVCHESDLSMGLANKIAKKYAEVICTNFEKTAKDNPQKSIYTGMPLQICNQSKIEAKKKFNIISTKPVLLVTGGSLGAKAINEFIFNNVDTIAEKFFIIHLVGKNNLNSKIKNDNYLQIDFSNDMWTLFKIADYAVSRAGANTIIELLSNEILTIFIPLPKTVSRGDQIENAKYFENQNLSTTILQENLSINEFNKKLNHLQKNAKLIKYNIKNAKITDGTSKIINILTK